MGTRTRQIQDPAASGAAETRRLLLRAAADVFADRGYRDATVREICRRARTNIASIKYHFGDKHALYAAVVRDTTPPPAAPSHATSPEQDPAAALALFIRNLLSRIAENGPESLHSRIMAREMIDPSPALDRLVSEFIRPQYAWLERLIRRMTGPDCPDDLIRDLANSVVSQVLFYKHCDAVLTRLHGQNRLDTSTVERLARHITAFSLAAIQSIASNSRSPRTLKRPSRS